MKIVLFGTSDFAVPTLEAFAGRHHVAAVVTQPDRPSGRGQKLTATPIKRAAQARGLTVLTPERLRPFIAEAQALCADAFVVASYGKIIPAALLELVPIAFNVHPSLLPLYRGATPLQTAIRDGRAETGVSIIAMDAGMDTGDVLLVEHTPLGARETYGELHDRLALRGAALALEAADRFAAGTLARRSQHDLAREYGIDDEAIAATATRPLRKEDRTIDWSLPAAKILDLVRSLAPQPLALTSFGGEQLKVAAASALDRDDFRARYGELAATAARGPVCADAPREPVLYALAGDERVVVLERVVAPGRGPLSGTAFARSHADRAVKR